MNNKALIQAVTITLGLVTGSVVEVAPAAEGTVPNWGRWVYAKIQFKDPLTGKVTVYGRNVNITDVVSLAVQPYSDEDRARAAAWRERDWLGYGLHAAVIPPRECTLPSQAKTWGKNRA